jgi:hypothetical protein
VPVGTDTFVKQFVAKTCRDIIEDVEKLDAIQDGFIHYQLLRFCQVTRMQYLNSHVILDNRCVLQQQHVDCKIADALLKKGTKQHTDGWDAPSSLLAGPGCTCASISPMLKVISVCLLMTFLGMLRFILLLDVLWLGWVLSPRNVRACGCPRKNDLKDASSWSSPPLLLLRDIHSKLLTQYDCREVCAPSPSQVGGASARPSSQNDIPQQQEAAQLSLPQLNRLLPLGGFLCA